MSDFDKEAEREKLRKKFARDEEKRANTRRMSELLLKGATMTNKHCDRCGDPLFRYEGETFCPTCRAGQSGGDGAGEASAPEAANEASAGAADPNPAAVDAETDESGGAADATPSDADSRIPSAPSLDVSSGESTRTPARKGGDGAAGSEAGASEAPGDLSEARASLVRTLTRFARLAERTDDPRRARELLAAAREAAEALAALE